MTQSSQTKGNVKRSLKVVPLANGEPAQSVWLYDGSRFGVEVLTPRNLQWLLGTMQIEEFFDLLEEIPEPSIIQQIRLLEKRPDKEAKSEEARLHPSSSCSDDMIVTLYSACSKEGAVNDIRHQWAHLLARSQPMHFSLYIVAAKLETSGYDSRQEWNHPVEEMFASELIEYCVTANDFKFAEFATAQAPLRTLVMCDLLRRVLTWQNQSERTKIAGTVLARSQQYVQDHRVRALGTLAGVTNSSVGSRELAMKLLVFFARTEKLKGLKIKSLDLSAESVNDSFLAKVEALTELRVLNLSNARLTSQGIKHLSSLENLEELSLHNTSVRDDDLLVLLQLPKLKKLDLSKTYITSGALDALSQLKVKKLNLAHTIISDDRIQWLKRHLRGCEVIWEK